MKRKSSARYTALELLTWSLTSPKWRGQRLRFLS
nr:MAG TPA: hypothetical protein [Caudoviricetes sp.]